MSEELSSQSLYDSSIAGELSYSFTTDSGIRYAAYFLDMSCYGENFHNIFTFNFEPEQNTRGYSDPKVANTLANIINKFFTENTNSLIFVCDSLDGLHLERHRLFNMWFCKYNDGSLEKIDRVILTPDYKICTSLIVHIDNPEKNSVIEIFDSLTASGFIPV